MPAEGSRVPRRSRAACFVAAALLGLFAALGAASTPAAAEPGRLFGPAPTPGAFGLVVWGGGPVAEIAADAGAQGCEAVSAWASNPGGGLLGFIFRAPDFVNRPFAARLGDSLPTSTPLVLVCSPPLRAAVSALSAGEARMIELVNGERAHAGLAPLRLDLELSAVARAHSRDMADREYFAHVNPDGQSPFDRMRAAGIDYRTAAENIARAGSVDVAHRLLMDSPGHHANILDPRQARIGIGIVAHRESGWLLTQAFAD